MGEFVRQTGRSLSGKVIDVHTHVGIAVLDYLGGAFPYCQSAESLVYRMNTAKVDVAVAFPLGSSAFFAPLRFLRDTPLMANWPDLSHVPYAVENRLICEEAYEKVPMAQGRILPFACIDPGRYVRQQIKQMEELADEYPVYGLKAVGVRVQSSHHHLAGKASSLMDFAAERDWPVLLHSTAYEGDKYCHTSVNLDVARKFPHVRFCLAHCLGFDKHYLDEADALPNVWVDCAAMKIQIEPEEILAVPERRFPSDYTDFRTVFRDLVRKYPKTMIWGTDSPAYSYIQKRTYADGSVVNFDLQGTYELEREALDALPKTSQKRVSNTNTRKFLFG